MCVVSFYSNRVSHITSRKRNCQYFEGEARCKILTCQATIRICISKEEITKGKCHNPGELFHENNEKLYSRNLSGEERIKRPRISVDNYYYQQIQDVLR